MFKVWGVVFGVVGLCFAATAIAADVAPQPKWPASKWAVTYYNNTPITELFNYDVVVLDASHGYDVRSLVARGQTVLAYLSIGEVENYRPYFDRVKQSGAVLMENENWPGSYYVDVRNQSWSKLLLEEIIPELLRQGYSGLMLDTVDNPIYLATVLSD